MQQISEKVRRIIHRKFWTDRGRKKCLEAIKEIAYAWDMERGAFPEDEFEGLAFYHFCLGYEPDDGDLEERRCHLDVGEDAADIRGNTEDNAADVEKD